MNSTLVAADAAEQKVKKKKRPLPPGQKLILYCLLVGLICLLVTRLKDVSVCIPALCQLPATPAAGSSAASSAASSASSVVPAEAMPFQENLNLDQLYEKLNEVSNQPKLKAGVFAIEPTTGRYVDLNGHDTFSAASMIKIPVLVALLQSIEHGLVDPNTILILRKDLMVGGSGYLQWRKPGSKITLKETTELMITVSDNTATNMIVDLLGGRQKLNAAIVSWGLQHTQLSSPLPDLEGTNTTSPYELAYLLGRIDKGEILSDNSRATMYDVMSRTRTRTLLPQGLCPGAKIYHKTGDIGSMVGDAGIIESAAGKRYIIAVQVSRPHNDQRANELVRTIAKLTYPEFTGEHCVYPPTPCAQCHHHHFRHRTTPITTRSATQPPSTKTRHHKRHR